MLQTLDFNDRAAVREAHRDLAQAPALVRFCDRAFDSVDPAGSRDALATLLLYKCADARHQSTDSIEQKRAAALTTLAARLSPAGKLELLPTRNAYARRNAFSAYLADPDRLRLTGQVCLALDDDAEALRLIAHAYTTRADRLELAANAYAIAMNAQRQAKGVDEAADDWRVTADACEQARLPAEACRKAANAYMRAASELAQRGQDGPAADAYQKASELYEQAGLPEQAADAGKVAADARQRFADAQTRVA